MQDVSRLTSRVTQVANEARIVDKTKVFVGLQDEIRAQRRQRILSTSESIWMKLPRSLRHISTMPIVTFGLGHAFSTDGRPAVRAHGG